MSAELSSTTSLIESAASDTKSVVANAKSATADITSMPSACGFSTDKEPQSRPPPISNIMMEMCNDVKARGTDTTIIGGYLHKSADYWEEHYNDPIEFPADKTEYEFLIDLCFSDPNRALTQGITVAAKILNDQEFDTFIRCCYDRKKYPRTYDVYTEWPSTIFNTGIWKRILGSYGDTFTAEEKEMLRRDGWSPNLYRLACEQAAATKTPAAAAAALITAAAPKTVITETAGHKLDRAWARAPPDSADIRLMLLEIAARSHQYVPIHEPSVLFLSDDDRLSGDLKYVGGDNGYMLKKPFKTRDATHVRLVMVKVAPQAVLSCNITFGYESQLAANRIQTLDGKSLGGFLLDSRDERILAMGCGASNDVKYIRFYNRKGESAPINGDWRIAFEFLVKK